jgi:hypothetical protein
MAYLSHIYTLRVSSRSSGSTQVQILTNNRAFNNGIANTQPIFQQ